MEMFVLFAVAALSLFSLGGMVALSPIGTILYVVICILLFGSLGENNTARRVCVPVIVVTPIVALAIFLISGGEIETSIVTNAIMITVMLITAVVSLLLQEPDVHKDDGVDQEDESEDESAPEEKEILYIPVGRSRQEERWMAVGPIVCEDQVSLGGAWDALEEDEGEILL